MTSSSNTAESVSVTSTAPSELEKVQEKFIKEINDHGIAHVFEWMHGWFGAVAKAMVQDDLQNQLGDLAKDPRAVNLYLMDHIMQLSNYADNHSTSPSSNLMKQARLSSMAKIVERNYHGYGSSQDVRRNWDAYMEIKNADISNKEPGKLKIKP